METSHIWLGVFPSEEQFDEYLEEQYEDDDAPISPFAADQSEMYYDHDWVERAFCESGDLRKLIDGASYSDDYVEGVMAAATALGIKSANSFILADANEFDDPQSVNGDGYTLWYIGKFTCRV